MAYTRVTEEERNLIYRWRQEDISLRKMARLLGRAASSICRELARNLGLRGYRPKQAHEKAQAQAKRPGPRRFTDEVRIDAEARLKEGWTPEMISERARLEGRSSVCKETIYKHIYADAKVGGILWKNLPRAKRKRRRRCPRQEGRGRGRIPNQRMIDTRPAEVETRRTIGHWEGDLINGAHNTGNLVTLVERNMNGLIRRLYPKKSSFAGIGEAELKRIDRFLNDRPRKCLGWMTPREKMTVFLGYAP